MAEESRGDATWRAGLGRLVRNEHLVLNLLAAVVGVAVGYASIGFRTAITLVHGAAFGAVDERLHPVAAGLPWWQLLLMPALGGLLVGLMLRFATGDRRVHGVPEVIAASALRGGRLPLKEGIVAALASFISLGFGASAGREGPVVHLGGTLASWLAARLRLDPSLAITILGCGVAAAVAASFNAPIAGVFFSLEVIVGHYALHAFAPVVIASVLGTLVSRAHLGDFPAFMIPDYAIVSMLEFPAFVLLGCVSALVAMIFIRSVAFVQDRVARIPVPEWLQPVGGGLAVGLIGIVLPHVYGVGYGATDDALGGRYALGLLIALIVAKTAATAITLGCRFGGGVFSPSLFLGAMTGAAFGQIAAAAFPDLAAAHGLYAIVGMGAVAAAVLGAPISTILIVFELTGDYAVTIAVMVAVAVATLISRQLLTESYFHHQLARRGLSVSGGRIRHRLMSARVADLISTDFAAVGPDAKLGLIERKLRTAPLGEILVTDADGALRGVVGFVDLEELDPDPTLNELINAADLARTNPATLTPEDSLQRALEVMERSARDYLPVVRDGDSRALVGVIAYKAVLRAYNQALRQAHAEEHGEIPRP